MKFVKPDDKALRRMTVRSVTVLIEALEGQRDELVKPYDNQIAFYKELREKKRKEEASA